MISRFLGSYPGIAAVVAFSGAWLWMGFHYDTLTLALSILALVFTQLVLRDTDEINCRLERKIDAIVEGTDADNSVLEEP